MALHSEISADCRLDDPSPPKAAQGPTTSRHCKMGLLPSSLHRKTAARTINPECNITVDCIAACSHALCAARRSPFPARTLLRCAPPPGPLQVVLEPPTHSGELVPRAYRQPVSAESNCTRRRVKSAAAAERTPDSASSTTSRESRLNVQRCNENEKYRKNTAIRSEAAAAMVMEMRWR